MNRTKEKPAVLREVVSIVGARMHGIYAPVSYEPQHEEILVHTCQHFGLQMRDTFFEGLPIPKPDSHADAGSGSHRKQTAAIPEGADDALIRELPGLILVSCDSRSMHAGALAAARLHIPAAPSEPGLTKNTCSFSRELIKLYEKILHSGAEKEAWMTGRKHIARWWKQNASQ